ncbi:MAG: TetR/AcrR family transcriptional regulator [Actinomycetia bacterium]|nr:TetR/AcrR family transcriptional regulator [Actinomycetes bacterium]
MVGKATEAVRRGRPRQFDEEQVVAAAIGAFFAKGFAATTLADLEGATGVDRSTLYNIFGGKRGLYDKATALYLDRAASSLFSVLHRGSADGLGDVVQFLERLRSGLTGDPVSPGCLIINDMATGANLDAARRYRELLDTGLRSALHRAADSGAIDPSAVDRRAVLLSAAVIGVNLISRHAGNNPEVDELLSAAIAEVSSWRPRPTG